MFSFKKKFITFIFLLLATSLFANNFASMTTLDLINLRGNVKPANIEKFGIELQKRLSTMSPKHLRYYGFSSEIKDKHGNQKSAMSCSAMNQRPNR